MRKSCFLIFLMLCIEVSADRTESVQQLQTGPFNVGTVNFAVDRDASSQVDAGQYQEGANVNGELLYIATLLESPGDAFAFDLNVPNDTDRYGESAGTVVPYTGYLFYPTTSDNPRDNYLVFVEPELPHMQTSGQAPIFADDSERYPLIVYSHGAGGHPTTYHQEFAETLASHGYIVFAIYHGDDRWGTEEGRRFNLRPLAIKTAIDELLAHPHFKDHIDVERIGGAGESFGGATMAALLGAKILNPDFQSIFENNVIEATVDPRIKAAATIVPYMGAGSYTFFGRDGEGGLTIDRPYLANASPADEVADYDKVTDVYSNIPGTKILIEYPGELHAFTEDARNDAFTWMKSFLDAHVLEDEQAVITFNDLASVSGTINESVVVETPVTHAATQYMQTTSNSANITSLHIVNNSNVAQSFTGTLYDGSGSQLGSANTSLGTAVPARGRLILSSTDLNTLFTTDPWSGPALLEVAGSADFELMSKLVSPSGLVSNTNCVREDTVLNVEGQNSVNRTFIRFINTSNQTLTNITGTLYDQNGLVIGSADTVFVDSLAAKAATWVSRENFEAILGTTWNDEAMLKVEPRDGLKLLNLNFVNEETFFNFSCFENNDQKAVYLQTTASSNNVSFTHLVNTASTSQQLVGTLYDGSGNMLGSPQQPLHDGDLAANARVIIASTQLETIFDTNSWSGPAILEVEGSSTFDVMTKLTSPSGLVSNTNCTRTGQVHNIEGFESSALTFVRFINTGAGDLTNITGSLYDTNGAAIGSTNQTLISSLPSKSATWLNRNNLSEIFGQEWNGEALLEVESNNSLRLLNLNFINGETFFNFSCYESS